MTDQPYRTPKCCYRKAPVRRENRMEAMYRHHNQVPTTAQHIILNRMERTGHKFIKDGTIRINHGLVPGEAKYIKEVTR